jgi:ABC-2 type transport system ATP-binding protein
MRAIEITGLGKTFHGKKGMVVEALKGVNLSVEEGEVFGFLGPNGAGKSTTIKCLVGLIRPTSGDATLMGEPAGSEKARFKLGYLPENPAFYEYLNAEEYMNFVGRSFKMPGKLLSERCEESLRLLDLWEARKRPIRSFSKGMVQRLGLAQVLIHDPDLYILDEPMSGLDPLGRALVKEIIVSLRKRGKSVFFSTHITADVESVCDRVAVIVNGEIRCVKGVEEIAVGGVTGFELRYVERGTETSKTLLVQKDGLVNSLAALQSSGGQILTVEPVRKSLEEFFVDIVRQG